MTDPQVALVGVAVALFGLDAAFALDQRFGILPPLPDDGTETLESDLWKWVVAALVVGYLVLVERASLATVGLRWPGGVRFAVYTAGGVAATMVATSGTYAAYTRLDLPTPAGFVENQLRRPVAARTFTALTAGVTETLLFQAYPITRLAPLLGSLPAAAAVAWLAFTGAHFFGDTFSAWEAVYIAVPALCMTLLWVLTGNLLIVATAHALVDAGSLLGPELGDDPGGQPAQGDSMN